MWNGMSAQTTAHRAPVPRSLLQNERDRAGWKGGIGVEHRRRSRVAEVQPDRVHAVGE